jgi:hypothetical protein
VFTKEHRKSSDLSLGMGKSELSILVVFLKINRIIKLLIFLTHEDIFLIPDICCDLN